MNTDVAVYQEFRGFTSEQEDLLKERLQEANIRQRPGASGRKLKYIKGDYAIATANRIFGLGKWGYKVVARSHELIEDEKKGKIEYYTADVELMVAGSMFSFPGDGLGIVTAPYTIEMHEKARKEATTDALKRALRHYGDQFGLSLYDEDNYIETEDGTVKQVKDVGKQPTNGYQRPAAQRVVDARPTITVTDEHMLPAQPTSAINAPVPGKLRKLFAGIGTTLETAQKMTFKQIFPDDNLTPEQCFQLRQVYDAWKIKYDEKAVKTA